MRRLIPMESRCDTYVQMVNGSYQVFDKATGNSVLGPNSISSLWNGFGGACQTGGAGDRWVISQLCPHRWRTDH